MNKKKHIIIIGLRRSGTTIFIDTLRQDKRLTCFDEPFNKYVQDKFTYYVHGFKEFYENKAILQDVYCPVTLDEEITDKLNTLQQSYLKALCSFEHTCIDETRTLLKIEAIREAVPDALIVLLIRDPRAWITSNLRIRGEWEHPDLPRRFFEYNDFGHWGYQYISELLNFEGYAHEQLMCLWDLFNSEAIKSQPDMIIQFEKFCYDPGHYLESIYNMLDIDLYKFDHSEIHKPNKAYDVFNSEWDKLNINEDMSKYVYW